MTTLSLRISIVKSNNVKMMQFDENVVVYDAMRIIRERVPDAAQGQGSFNGPRPLIYYLYTQQASMDCLNQTRTQ